MELAIGRSDGGVERKEERCYCLFVCFRCILLRQFLLAASRGCMAALAWPFSFLPVRGYGARAPRREAEAGENGGRVRGYRAWRRGGAGASLPAGGIKGGELRAFTQLGRISFKMGLCTAGGGKGCNKIVGSYIFER